MFNFMKYLSNEDNFKSIYCFLKKTKNIISSACFGPYSDVSCFPSAPVGLAFITLFLGIEKPIVYIYTFLPVGLPLGELTLKCIKCILFSTTFIRISYS